MAGIINLNRIESPKRTAMQTSRGKIATGEKMTTINIRISKSTVVALDDVVRKIEKTKSEIIRLAIEQFLASKYSKDELLYRGGLLTALEIKGLIALLKAELDNEVDKNEYGWVASVWVGRTLMEETLVKLRDLLESAHSPKQEVEKEVI